MSTFLINASNLKNGGGLQVADSICGQLNRFPQHFFIVVLSTFLDSTAIRIKEYNNVKVITYNIPDSINSIILGRDRLLDGLVQHYAVDVVITVFGPSRWRPRVPHLSGFALSQLVIPESPFFERMKNSDRLKWFLWRKIRQWSLKRSADCFWTENPLISTRFSKLIQCPKVYTVTNYYNQVFDQPKKWQRSVRLPSFEGTTMLTVSSTAKHKNLKIMIPVSEYLEQYYPGFQFRFVLTCRAEALNVPEHLMHHFVFVDKVDVSECPNLYAQADIMFMPTLLECFSATYPEAMRMEVPIVTTDLEFAHGICGDAACYYSAVNPQAAAEAIYKVVTDKSYARQLAYEGERQLQKFDNYEQRAEKLVGILEEIASSN